MVRKKVLDKVSERQDPRKEPGLGDRELELLRFVAHGAAISVGEAAEAFGGPRGLARTTVQTMLERLHRKGKLRRKQGGGVYRYESRQAPAELLRDLVSGFVEGSLAGSVSPFVAYLAEAENLSDQELNELEDLVERLQDRRKDR